MSRELPTTSQTSSLRTHPRVRRGISKPRSEEHTSELQSPCNLVCRLLLEKKKKTCAYAAGVTEMRTSLSGKQYALRRAIQIRNLLRVLSRNPAPLRLVNPSTAKITLFTS